MNTLTTFQRGSLLMTLALLALPAAGTQPPTVKPVKVVIEEDQTEATERTLPLDPLIRIAPQYAGNMAFGVISEGKPLTCGAGANSLFRIDGQLVMANGKVLTQPLPKDGTKKREGLQAVWTHGDIKITMILEAVPGKPVAKSAAVQKRRMDTLLIKYLIENNGAKAHQVGARTYIDTMCGNNDGAIFASPTTHPGQLLDGVMLKDKAVPDFIEMLEVPNLQNPGFKGVFTFKMGNKLEGPSKIVLTGMGAGVMGDGWEVVAAKANNDSAVAFYWDPQPVLPNARREIAFALGQGIACSPENEGKVSVSFGGSFEPNKEFTVTAYVDDPIEGQSLTLELPKGMESTSGKPMQAVPLLGENATGHSIVLWKGSVKELGDYTVRIRSSTGVIYTRNISITRAGEK